MRYYQWLIIIVITIILTAIVWIGKDNPVAVEQNLVRLHVLANSDSPEDQALKLKVRDTLLMEFSLVFSSATSLDEAKSLIGDRLSEIESIASQQIIKYGFTYFVEAELGTFSFPTKAYGGKVYPAGNYEALRVVIGQGQGANWWCVMFPPLCFVDISSGVAREQDYEVETLVEDIKLVPKIVIEDDVEVVYTFKISKWWGRIRGKLASLFSSK